MGFVQPLQVIDDEAIHHLPQLFVVDVHQLQEVLYRNYCIQLVFTPQNHYSCRSLPSDQRVKDLPITAQKISQRIGNEGQITLVMNAALAKEDSELAKSLVFGLGILRDFLKLSLPQCDDFEHF